MLTTMSPPLDSTPSMDKPKVKLIVEQTLKPKWKYIESKPAKSTKRAKKLGKKNLTYGYWEIDIL